MKSYLERRGYIEIRNQGTTDEKLVRVENNYLDGSIILGYTADWGSLISRLENGWTWKDDLLSDIQRIGNSENRVRYNDFIEITAWKINDILAASQDEDISIREDGFIYPERETNKEPEESKEGGEPEKTPKWTPSERGEKRRWRDFSNVVREDIDVPLVRPTINSRNYSRDSENGEECLEGFEVLRGGENVRDIASEFYRASTIDEAEEILPENLKYSNLVGEGTTKLIEEEGAFDSVNFETEIPENSVLIYRKDSEGVEPLAVGDPDYIEMSAPSLD